MGCGEALEVVDVAQQLEREGEILIEQLLNLVQIRFGLIDHLEQLHHHQLGRWYGGLLHHLRAAEKNPWNRVTPSCFIRSNSA